MSWENISIEYPSNLIQKGTLWTPEKEKFRDLQSTVYITIADCFGNV